MTGNGGEMTQTARPAALRQISPTDVATYVRLEQCERYLRLRMEHTSNPNLMRDYGVRFQSIPPLLTRSGARFEQRVESSVSARHPTRKFVHPYVVGEPGPDDNSEVLDAARSLGRGETIFLFQARLHVLVDGWWMRGDPDVLRLHRDERGCLHVLIADMKSTSRVKVEHRLQVAFYHEMVSALLRQHGMPFEDVRIGILYRGPAEEPATDDPEEVVRRRLERERAAALFEVPDALLEMVEDEEEYVASVRDLVTSQGSVAERVAGSRFEEVRYHLSPKCDGCIFSEHCMKWSAEHDDLSLIPHLSAQEKSALLNSGVRTTRELAMLKEPSGSDPNTLVTLPGKESLVRRLSANRQVGPRLDELICRARQFRRRQGDPIEAPGYLPSKGYGSLPYCAPNHNPNLVRVYVDAQFDYLNERAYMLGALVAACEGGREIPERRASIVHITDGPPTTPESERDLILRWVRDTMRAVVELAAPDEQGEPRAPIHIIFYDSEERRLLLEALGRHLNTILGATALYDFVTQIAAFDSPVVTFLDEEMRELRSYPMLCQSLQEVARYLGFDWNTPRRFAELFRARLFDSSSRLDTPAGERWYTSRARFGSRIPLEYAYGAWDELDPPPARGHDELRPFRRATVPELTSFEARRLEAMEHIARSFHGNEKTTKTTFHLPDLAQFVEKSGSLAQAMDEFVTIERHVALADWKRLRLPSPERRMLSGDTLVARYLEEDQEPEVRERNRENLRRARLREQYLAASDELTPEQRRRTALDVEGLSVWLRIESEGTGCGLEEALALKTLNEGDGVVIYPRWTFDSRLPPEERGRQQPTPKQLLYGPRGTLSAFRLERGESNELVRAWVRVDLRESWGGRDMAPFVFTGHPRPLEPGELYTLDPDPNDWYSYWYSRVVKGLLEGGRNTLYDRLARTSTAPARWPRDAREGQERFLEGLKAFHRAGHLHEFEPSKHEYIGCHGDAPALLVQGPPGTGKSYTTAWAVYARIQGAMAVGMPLRVMLSCKTHAATNVLLDQAVKVGSMLGQLRERDPSLFERYFDPRLLSDVSLYRIGAREGEEPRPPVVCLYRDSDRPRGAPRASRVIRDEQWCIAAATPGSVYGIVKDSRRRLFGNYFCDCLVLDETSQMNLPEAVMAALPLTPDGQLIVVGDPRQMPPIVQHDWIGEPRRTFQEYRSYASLYESVAEIAPPTIKFERSFRLHSDLARFLRDEIYVRDGIDYRSDRHDVLQECEIEDEFVRAVLRPEHPLVVVVHSEEGSQTRNEFERGLLAPVLETLSRPPYGLDPEDGLGVVVPHRDQRAEYQLRVEGLVVRDPETDLIVESAVDTVERFQGGERTAICVSATESDREYLLATSEFLLDPRRLTVALSRARRKMVLVASRSVFSLFSGDEDAFENLQIWKNLLRRTCTVPLWQGERCGRRVEVWGNVPGNRLS